MAKDAPEYSVAASRATFEKYLPLTVDAIRETGAKVIVFSQVPNHGAPLEGCDNAPRFLFNDADFNARCEAVTERLAFTDAFIEDLANEDGVYAAIPSEYFCDNRQYCCRLFEAGIRLHRNADYLNEYGAMFLARRWEADSEFPFTAGKRQQIKFIGPNRPALANHEPPRRIFRSRTRPTADSATRIRLNR